MEITLKSIKSQKIILKYPNSNIATYKYYEFDNGWIGETKSSIKNPELNIKIFNKEHLSMSFENLVKNSYDTFKKIIEEKKHNVELILEDVNYGN